MIYVSVIFLCFVHNSDVVMEIVKCDEWRTALRHSSVGYSDDPQRITSPFRQMIRKMPRKKDSSCKIYCHSLSLLFLSDRRCC